MLSAQTGPIQAPVSDNETKVIEQVVLEVAEVFFRFTLNPPVFRIAVGNTHHPQMCASLSAAIEATTRKQVSFKQGVSARTQSRWLRANLEAILRGFSDDLYPASIKIAKEIEYANLSAPHG